jgi:hypothetical protein
MGQGDQTGEHSVAITLRLSGKDMTMQKTFLLALVLAMVVASAPRAQAQDSFPASRVTIVVPSPAGSTTDALARLVAEQLSQSWGKPVIVENNSRGLRWHALSPMATRCW